MTAFDKTTYAARCHGWQLRAIDDDCFIAKRDNVEIQVSYDRFSPSFKFVSAELAVDGNWLDSKRLHGYPAVRKEMAKLPARV